MGVVIEDGAIVSKNAIILGNSHIQKGACVGDFSKIINSKIEKGANVNFSVIEDSIIKENALIGNYSYIHDNSLIKENAIIGHSVEIKKSIIGENTKVKHLTYIGDSKIGKNVNIGACTVFANYDGVNKNNSLVEDNVFIGSGSIIVSPIKIEEGAFIAAGSVIDKNIPKNSLAIARSRQINKENYFNKD